MPNQFQINTIPTVENSRAGYKRKWMDFFRGERSYPPRAPICLDPLESESIINQAQEEFRNEIKKR